MRVVYTAVVAAAKCVRPCEQLPDEHPARQVKCHPGIKNQCKLKPDLDDQAFGGLGAGLRARSCFWKQGVAVERQFSYL